MGAPPARSTHGRFAALVICVCFLLFASFSYLLGPLFRLQTLENDHRRNPTMTLVTTPCRIGCKKNLAGIRYLSQRNACRSRSAYVPYRHSRLLLVLCRKERHDIAREQFG